LTIGDKGSYLHASLGASHVHEDDAHRAVRVALELRQFFHDCAFLDSVQFGLSSGMMRVAPMAARRANSLAPWVTMSTWRRG